MLRLHTCNHAIGGRVLLIHFWLVSVIYCFRAYTINDDSETSVVIGPVRGVIVLIIHVSIYAFVYALNACVYTHKYAHINMFTCSYIMYIRNVQIMYFVNALFNENDALMYTHTHTRTHAYAFIHTSI